MDVLNILNTIRDNASSEYQNRIPEATQTNIETVQAAMTDPNNAIAVNEFMNTLLNVLIKQIIHDKLFSNPLKELKKGPKPLGDTVEEIYTNFLKAEAYDPTGATLLQRKKPDTKTLFHRMNRQDKYKVTVSMESLRKAFASYDRLDSYIQSIINSLFNSSELDEFILTKQLIKQALDNNAMVVVNVEDPFNSKEAAEKFITTVKTVSGGMVFPSTEYNAYTQAQDVDEIPITTFSRLSEQVLIIDNATNVNMNVNVLASIFNMSVAEFNETKKIVIDAFPDPSIRAALVDEQFFQIFDDLIFFTSWRNPEGLYDNYYLHIWQTLAYSILVNGVVFKVGSDEDDDGEIETFNVTHNLETGITSSNKRKTVTEGGIYTTTLSGTVGNVVVTMGGNTVANAYDPDTKKVAISTITGDIVITAVTTYDIDVELGEGISSSNNKTKITAGTKYETTITATSPATVGTVTVEMGGETVADAYDSTTGKITINSVTGDLEITVTAG